ncbi:hypothetical protein MRX96_026134 [Rhipicephalus microplus]
MASKSSACETSAHSAIECVRDNESSWPDVDVLRANITDERHACSWVEDYGLKTNTSWVVDFVKPTAKCERDTINAQGEQHNPVPQDEMAATTPPQDEEMPDSEPVLDTESCASISHLEQQESEDADNSLEALIEQLRQVHAEEKSNAAYRRHLLSGTKHLRRLQEQKCGVGAMMAMDAALAQCEPEHVKLHGYGH